MPKSSNQKLKLLYIIRTLMEISDERHPVSTAKIIEMLSRNGISAERKSIYDDIEALKQIKHLLKNEGLTLEGTAARMNENRHSVEKRVKALDSLKRIRASLMEVKKAL